MDDRGIDNLILKGVTLGPLAYDNGDVKFAWDIDIIVKRNNVYEAMAAIENEGYQRDLPDPGLSERQLKTYIDLSRELVFKHKTRDIYPELKWIFDSNRHLVRGITVDGRTQNVSIGNGFFLAHFGQG